MVTASSDSRSRTPSATVSGGSSSRICDAERLVELGQRGEVEVVAEEADQRGPLLRLERLEKVAEIGLVERRRRARAASAASPAAIAARSLRRSPRRGRPRSSRTGRLCLRAARRRLRPPWLPPPFAGSGMTRRRAEGLSARPGQSQIAGPKPPIGRRMSMPLYLATGEWCGREDSNFHGLPHSDLNAARLPVPPRPRKCGPHVTNRLPGFKASGSAEGFAELGLGLFEHFPALSRQVLAGPVDVESEHRHGRAEGWALPFRAGLRRAFERASDAARVLEGEDIGLERQRMAVSRHRPRPLRAGRRSCGFRARR